LIEPRPALRLHAAWWAIALAVAGTACTGGAPTAHPTKSASGSGTAFRLSVQVASFHLKTPLERAVAVLANDTIYVAGGLDGAGRSVPDVFTLDPATGEVAAVGTMPQAFHDAAGAVIGGRLFVFGGGSGESSDAVQRFDLATGRATVVGHLPKALSDLSSTTVGQTVYLIGGYDGIKPQAAIYSTTDGVRFRTVARLPKGLRYTSVASVGKSIVVAGGVSAAGPVSDVDLFDTVSGHVSVLGRLPIAVGHAGAFTLSGRVFLAGGRDAKGKVGRQVVAIDPVGRTITAQPSLPAGVSDAAAVTDGSTAWLIGGWRGTALTQVLTANPPRA